ncbi:copper resistance protein CopC [Bacillus sp. C11]|nr:copper resistance protein CopC [Neobacillus terrae]
MILSLLFLFSFPTFSSAHAFITKSNPSENQVINRVPGKVWIQFDEEIQPSFQSIEVFDSTGKRIDQKDGQINPDNPTIIECSLKKNLKNGTYRVNWRVVSSDGHPIQGVIPFQIGKKEQTQANTGFKQETRGYTPKADLIVIRWIQYISNSFLIGILFFFLFVLPKDLLHNIRIKRSLSVVLKYSFFLLALSLILSLPLQATIESGSPWTTVFSDSVMSQIIFSTSFGKTWTIQITMLLLLMLPVLWVSKHGFSKRLWVWISFVFGIGLLLTKAYTSHAASNSHPFLPITIDFLHLLTASIWIGSLLCIVLLSPLTQSQETRSHFFECIRQFSKWGVILVILLSITGVYGSFLFIPTLQSLIYTDYGRTMLGKVLLLMIMVFLAAFNFINGKRGVEKGLPFSIKTELATGIVILLLTVILTNLPTAMASPGAFNETKTDKHGNGITFKVTPNTIGKNEFKVFLKNSQGKRLKNIEQVTLTFTSLEMEMGEDTVTLKEHNSGEYEWTGFNFNMSGKWSVKVHVLTKDLDTMDANFTCIVGSQ